MELAMCQALWIVSNLPSPVEAKRFGRRRVPKIVDGLTIFIYCELQKGRWIPGDGPVLLDATTATLDTGILRSHQRPRPADPRGLAIDQNP